MAGVKDAVVPLYEIVPGIMFAPWLSVKVVALIESGSMASLNVAVIILLSTTPVALVAGSVEITVGAAREPVVNVHT